jgi:hypothetical protein
VYGDDIQPQSGRKLGHKADIYSAFLMKSIEDTIDDKIKLDQSNSCCTEIYEYTKVKYNKLVEILAICTIFDLGEVKEEYHPELENNGGFINRFMVAKLDKDYKNVYFQHKSYAEYLTAMVLFKQLTVENQKPTLNDSQLKSVLLDQEFSKIRWHVCGILASSPKTNMIVQLDVITEEEKNVLELLIRENSYDLFMLLKERLRCAHEKYVMKNSKGEEMHLLYIALKQARKEFVQELIQDGAEFENIYHEKYVERFAVLMKLNNQAKCHIDSLKSIINQIDQFVFALKIAVIRENKDMMEILIENDGEIGSRGHWKVVASYEAIKGKSLKVLELLTEKYAELTDYLSWSAELNQSQFIFSLDENKPKTLREALLDATDFGYLEFCRPLFGLPSNPKQCDEYGEWSVRHATARGHLQCVLYLPQHHESVDVSEKVEEQPAMRQQQHHQKNVDMQLTDCWFKKPTLTTGAEIAFVQQHLVRACMALNWLPT